MSLQTISPQTLEKYVAHPAYIIIDLRSKEEYNKGHIRGALNYPYDQCIHLQDGFPKNKKYILYCQRGGSSLLAARWMDRQGYTVMSVAGGYEACSHLTKSR